MDELTIAAVHGWECLDSRGRPTVGCRIELAGGGVGRAIVPAGASTGTHEAVEQRDGGSRYGGWGVRKAVTAVRDELAPAVVGSSAIDRVAVDRLLEDVDGTATLERTGANAVLAVSLAVTIARADGLGLPLWRSLDPGSDDRSALLPMPMVNILSGGAHAGRAIDLQDVLVVPVGATTFAQAMEWVADVRACCAELLDARGGWAALVADEGGLSARLATNEAALALVTDAIERSGHPLGSGVAIAVDVAANQLMHQDRLVLSDSAAPLGVDGWLELLEQWCLRYPVISLEDVVTEDDWTGWEVATERFADIQVLGDDLFATDARRLAKGVQAGAANSVLIKVNQAGTVSRAERVLREAHSAGYATVVSARSGDTEDSWLADLAVGWRAGQIKVGSTMRSERTAKWNRLLELESAGSTTFAGRGALAPAARDRDIPPRPRTG